MFFHPFPSFCSAIHGGLIRPPEWSCHLLSGLTEVCQVTAKQMCHRANRIRLTRPQALFLALFAVWRPKDPRFVDCGRDHLRLSDFLSSLTLNEQHDQAQRSAIATLSRVCISRPCSEYAALLQAPPWKLDGRSLDVHNSPGRLISCLMPQTRRNPSQQNSPLLRCCKYCCSCDLRQHHCLPLRAQHTSLFTPLLKGSISVHPTARIKPP